MAGASMRSYSKVLQRARDATFQTSNQQNEPQNFTRETEVVAKLPQKRTRQYIYDLLTKLKIPFKHIESIVEKGGGLVDFTCSTVGEAQHLAAAMQRHKDVEFVRMVLSEFTDVKVHWVPGRFPNERIIAAIERHHGKFTIRVLYATATAFETADAHMKQGLCVSRNAIYRR